MNRQDVTLAGLSPAFEGFRIAPLLSDFHHSPWISARYIREGSSDADQFLRPNLIALTGDFVDRGKEWVPGCMQELAGLRAPERSGRGAGKSTITINARRPPCARVGAKAGIGDLTNCRPALASWRGIAAHRRHGRLLGRSNGWIIRSTAYAVRSRWCCSSSNPDYAEPLKDERVGLMLSGHTHGGQCVFPFISAPVLPSRFGQKYASGLCQGPVTQVFVTRGAGTSWLPVRLGCRVKWHC